MRDKKRNLAILEKILCGAKIKDVATEHGLSSSRVSDIVSLCSRKVHSSFVRSYYPHKPPLSEEAKQNPKKACPSRSEWRNEVALIAPKLRQLFRLDIPAKKRPRFYRYLLKKYGD